MSKYIHLRDLFQALHEDVAGVPVARGHRSCSLPLPQFCLPPSKQAVSYLSPWPKRDFRAIYLSQIVLARLTITRLV